MQSRRRSTGLKLNEKSMRSASSSADCYPRGWTRTDETDAEPLGVSVSSCAESRRPAPGWTEPLEQIKIPRLCKFHGVEIPRRINRVRSSPSSRENAAHNSPLYSATSSSRAVVLGSAECSGKAFANTVTHWTLAPLMRPLKPRKIRILPLIIKTSQRCGDAYVELVYFRNLWFSVIYSWCELMQSDTKWNYFFTVRWYCDTMIF